MAFETVTFMTDDALPFLSTFLRAAELGSFTAAARALGISQAAVSQRIQILESSLRTAVFRREAGRISLTEAGSKLEEYAKRIVELHSGRIWLESTVGKGSTFRFSVPIRVDRRSEIS